MLMSCCTLFANNVAAEEISDIRVSDLSTMDGWKNYFGTEVESTKNAGSVWTDKTVLTDSSAFGNTEIGMNSEDDFLVSLSAIASNKSVNGYSNTPTDTMLVLDVSGSMNKGEGHNGLAEEMVDAANDSIAELLSGNKHSRIGVVLYSGLTSEKSDDDAVLALPLDRYTTASDGKYLSYTETKGEWKNPYTTETVSIDPDVQFEKTGDEPQMVSKDVVGATYIQKGVMLAMNQFTSDSNTATVDDPQLGTLKRKPVVVLMSDGAPTLGSTEFTNPKKYNLGTGSSTNAELGFLSQLSAAYAKLQINNKYNSSCLFYTLGLGVGDDSVAASVLNPSASSGEINTLWEIYNKAKEGDEVPLTDSAEEESAPTVTKISQTLERNYVDGYFKVDASSKNMAKDLKKAFADIVETIQLQSSYYPTLVTDSVNNSGYVTFCDRIGEYMEVTDMKGVLLNNTLYSGAELAKDFSVNDELASAVQSQLGLKDIEAAKSLINSACKQGQISYNSDTEFSNYIGWYANAKGEFIGFWYDGINSSFDNETQPADIVKSYLYCGDVGGEQGVSSSNMRYLIVQVKESLATGEQTVSFAVPAALIPIVSYDVTLDKNNEISDLSISGAKEPIRLVYGVGLKEEINEQTIRDKVSEAYLAENTNTDGSVSFFTNKYEADNSTGYDKVNTVACFTPSKQNEKYYCLKDSPVYSDDKGTLLESDIEPDGKYYCAFTVYESKDGTAQAKTVYKALSKQALNSAIQKHDGMWYIPSDIANVNPDSNTEKTENKTNTLKYSYAPFVNYLSDEEFNICSTLGNNGRLTIMPVECTGNLTVAKEVSHDFGTDYEIPSDKTFDITVTLQGSDIYGKTFNARHTNGLITSVITDENGSFTVNLKNDEQIEIFDLPEGTVAYVKENNPGAGFTPEYRTDGQISDGSATITDSQTATVIVTNNYSASEVYAGNISVTGKKTLNGREWKESDSFTIELQKQIFDTEWQTIAADTVIGTDADKTFDLSDEFSEESYSKVGTYNYRITEIEPESERAGGVEYDKTAHSFGVVVTDKDMDGSLEISEVKAYSDSIIISQTENGWTVNADFTNTYNTLCVSYSISGQKILTGREMQDSEFTFILTEAKDSNGNVDDNAQKQETKNNADGAFSFEPITFTEDGIYYYVVSEVDSSEDNIIYDETRYVISITVTDNGEGSLVISDVICNSIGDDSTAEIRFENKYVEPTTPTQVTEPLTTAEPTKPTKPTEPITTAEPTEPTEQTEPTEFTKPTQPTEPAEPTKATEPTEPTEPTKATESIEPTKPTEPTKTTEPSNPIKPVNPCIPSTPDEPQNNNNSDASNNSGNTGTVKTFGTIQTGDDRNYYYLLASLIVSGMALYGTVSYRKRKTEK